MRFEDVHHMFQEALLTVWGDVGTSVSFEVVSVPPPAGGVLAALRYDTYDAEARGRKLLRHASHHTLCVALELLKKQPAVILKVLLHEAIHVGYPRHNKAFAAVAAEVGTASTERAIENAGFVVEVQDGRGSRFKKVFATQERAEALAFAHAKRAGAGRYRVVY